MSRNRRSGPDDLSSCITYCNLLRSQTHTTTRDAGDLMATLRAVRKLQKEGKSSGVTEGRGGQIAPGDIIQAVTPE